MPAGGECRLVYAWPRGKGLPANLKRSSGRYPGCRNESMLPGAASSSYVGPSSRFAESSRRSNAPREPVQKGSFIADFLPSRASSSINKNFYRSYFSRQALAKTPPVRDDLVGAFHAVLRGRAVVISSNQQPAEVLQGTPLPQADTAFR